MDNPPCVSGAACLAFLVPVILLTHQHGLEPYRACLTWQSQLRRNAIFFVLSIAVYPEGQPSKQRRENSTKACQEVFCFVHSHHLISFISIIAPSEAQRAPVAQTSSSMCPLSSLAEHARTSHYPTASAKCPPCALNSLIRALELIIHVAHRDGVLLLLACLGD
jgi:hypothetical protein